MVAPRLAIVLLVAIAMQSGCAGLQDADYSFANHVRAEACWLSKTTLKERRACSQDFEKGWKRGFYDRANGIVCDLPPVPPPCYWNAKYQNCEGQAAIANWYKGYQCGSASAESAGFPYFHNIPTGPTAPVINRPGCGACYAPECCQPSCQASTEGFVAPVHQYGESFGLIGPAGASLSDTTPKIRMVSTTGN